MNNKRLSCSDLKYEDPDKPQQSLSDLKDFYREQLKCTEHVEQLTRIKKLYSDNDPSKTIGITIHGLDEEMITVTPPILVRMIDELITETKKGITS